MLIDLIKHSLTVPCFTIHGVRRIMQGISWTEPEMPPALDILKQLGYGKQKITRLHNLYYNREEIEKAKAKLKQREGEEHSSVAILTRNMEKTHPAAQGWCVQSIVVSERWHRKERIVTADVFYRSTELILKFGADLTLLHNIFEAMEIQPRPVRFYFANAYVSAVFFPLLFQFTPGVAFLEHIRRHDKDFWFLACKAVSRYLDPHNRYTYKAQAKQWENMRRVNREDLDRYFMKHIPEYHEPHLPRKR